MKSNRLTIQIFKPVGEVFAFTVDPKNAPKWIETISKAETSEWPVKVGSVYRNQNKSGAWTEYEVSALEINKVFELMAKDGNYHVRYTFTSLADYKCELDYFEWVDEGDLEAPFSQDALKKLKSLLESNN